MPVYDSHKAIFIHIPKTAGTTINNILGIKHIYKPCDKDFSMDILYGNTNELELDHLTAAQAKLFIPKQKWTSYRKFAVVRNPYDRMVSQFFYAKEKKDYRFIGNNHFESFHDFLGRLDDIFEPYMEICSHIEKSHYIPQYKFVYGNDNKSLLDIVLRFENLQYEITANGLDNILPSPSMQEKCMRSHHGSKEIYYTRDLQNIVEKYYKYDFDVFQYSLQI